MRRGVRVLLLASVLFSQVARAGDDASYRIFVSNESSGDLTVIDGRTLAVTATVPLGKRPRGLQLAPDGRTLYVALSGSPLAPPGVDETTLPPPDKAADGIGVVDLGSLRLQRVIRGVSDPEQLAVSADGRRLYVASEDTGRAVVLDASSGRVLASTPVGGEPEGVAVRPDGRYVYVTSEEDHAIAVLDARSGALTARIPVGQRPRVVTFAPDGHHAWVTGELDASLTLIDATRHRPMRRVTLPGPGVRPMGVALAPRLGRLYVTTGRGGRVLALDAASLARIGAVAVGERPWGIAIAPDERRLFVANGPSNDLSVVDAHTLRVTHTIEVGARPWGVAVGK